MREGRLATGSASTYKLPSWSEVPETFEVAFLPRATQPGVVSGSKAVGEPPLMLAISVREALRDAVAAFGERDGSAAGRHVRQPRDAGARVLRHSGARTLSTAGVEQARRLQHHVAFVASVASTFRSTHPGIRWPAFAYDRACPASLRRCCSSRSCSTPR